jgi:hypothetical protein
MVEGTAAVMAVGTAVVMVEGTAAVMAEETSSPDDLVFKNYMDLYRYNSKGRVSNCSAFLFLWVLISAIKTKISES